MTLKRHLAPFVAILILLPAMVMNLGWARGELDQAELQPENPFGEWKGHYLCAQGITGLTLTVREDSSGAVAALFDFYPLPDNPTETGQFTMKGDWRADDRRVILSPQDWIEQPDGWSMVGLELKTSTDFEIMTGIVTNSTCGPVFLERDGDGVY